MPKIIPQSELDEIAKVIEEFPDGMAISGIKERLSSEMSTRMLQGRLTRLEADGRINSSGKKSATRYFPVISTEVDNAILGEVIPLSPQGRKIQEIIRRPLASRTPVGYNSDFLHSYIPNKTQYLSRGLMEDLYRVGQVGIDDLPAGTYIRQVLDRLLIDLAWNSSRLEGNTYSLLETERLIDVGEGAEGRETRETQMIINHKESIEMLAESAEEIGFNRYTICNLHALLSNNLLTDPGACGRLRSLSVGISGSVFQPLDVPQLIEERFEEILEKAEEIENPFEQSFFVTVHLPYLQPFEDVNKRVSRLAANIPFVQHNLCPLSFIDVDTSEYLNSIIGVYELNQIEYLKDVFVWAYQRSAMRYSAVLQSLGDPDPFRLKYRNQIRDFVREVILKKYSKSEAAKWISDEAKTKSLGNDLGKFIEVVETELMNLHGGSIARYRIRPGEYEVWKKGWR